jgi:hypothetical protein
MFWINPLKWWLCIEYYVWECNQQVPCFGTLAWLGCFPAWYSTRLPLATFPSDEPSHVPSIIRPCRRMLVKLSWDFKKNSTARHTMHLPISHVLPNQKNWQRKKSLIGTNRYRWLSLWSQYMRLFVATRSPYSPKKMPATSKMESL